MNRWRKFTEEMELSWKSWTNIRSGSFSFIFLFIFQRCRGTLWQRALFISRFFYASYLIVTIIRKYFFSFHSVRLSRAILSISRRDSISNNKILTQRSEIKLKRSLENKCYLRGTNVYVKLETIIFLALSSARRVDQRWLIDWFLIGAEFNWTVPLGGAFH